MQKSGYTTDGISPQTIRKAVASILCSLFTIIINTMKYMRN